DPDKAGHADSWTLASGRYTETLRQCDDYIGDVMNAIEGDPVLAGKTILIVVTDHGGGAPTTHHNQEGNSLNYKIPMFIWGAGVAEGTEFYSINGSVRTDPGTGRPNFDLSDMAGQPLRNGDSGNLALQMLGLPAIPYSTINELQDIVLNTSVCGDWVVSAGEDCDDGNTADGDCCSSTCSYETPGSPCDDGDACTSPDTCDGAGSCDAGAPVVCDDSLFCNGVESCDSGLGCQAGSPPNCDDGTFCTDDSCDEGLTQCVNAVVHGNCSNGLFCDGDETCDPALDCQAGTPVDCNDGLLCTDDACIEATDQCANTPVVCDNGSFCDGTEGCDPLLGCIAGPPVDCSDSVACTNDSCDEGSDICVNTPDDFSCDDGQQCNGVETCDPTLDCQAGTPLDCDDGDECTADSCDAISGCAHDPIALCGTAIPTVSGWGQALVALLMVMAGALLLTERKRLRNQLPGRLPTGRG
ncbi:MAG: alkaline phosphatase family protein, partial [Deltaproteobacteria bacterium]|nr:alkaline phosphatase family protein [Deltaproteobacteria bacterium]